jgi:hypothetical protein
MIWAAALRRPPFGDHGGMNADLEAATTFVHTNARVLERHRLALLRGDGDGEPVVRALLAYRNDDGGFGHALEPDLRAPHSQPAGVQTAMELLHEAGRTGDDPLVAPAADFLLSVTRDDGGVPFVLENAMAHPHGPPWRAADASSLTQTAANAAALHALGVRHPWLDGADAFLWARIDALDLGATEPTPGLGYDVRFSTAFLDAVPDEERAIAALERLAPGLRASGLVAERKGDVQAPLDLSPWPGARSRRLFTSEELETDLDALAGGQDDDGGWRFPWPAWSDGATQEWRGVVTLHALRVLRGNGRL